MLQKPFIGRRLAASLALLVTTALLPAAAQAQNTGVPSKPSITDFFKASTFSAPRLSPDGTRLSAILSDGSEVTKLVVFELSNLKASKVVASFSDVQIASAQWVNDKRLVFSVKLPAGSAKQIGGGLWGVDPDGEDLRALISPEFESSMGSHMRGGKALPPDWVLLSTLDDGSDDVIVLKPTFDTKRQLVRVGISKLNTRNSVRTALATDAPNGVQRWVLDRQGQPMWATTSNNGRMTIYRRNEGQDGWQQWDEGPMIAGVKAIPAWVGPAREVYALQDQGAKSTAALYRLNPTTQRPENEPLVALAGYDLDPEFVYDAQAKTLVGLHYLSDAPGSVWFDASMRQAQAEIDKLLPATVNRLDCTRCTQVPTLLVRANSDRAPEAYYLYNRETRTITPLSSSRPWIDPLQMARVDVQQFAARDGLEIPVQITLPKGPVTGPRPTVMLIHGGPNVRGNYWQWSPEAQFLASRGYVVIEPEFRGSTGYGFKHFQAGWKKWGQEMQDDVTDATQWAIKKGLADPKRICIAGASYGGYATLMGLIREPNMYQCGINWVGVTDIEMLYTVNWSDAADVSLKYGMPLLIGDPDKDKQMMQANSPLRRAAEIKRPLLLAYGEDDRRVPIVHGTAFRDAVKATNPDVEWVSYIREGHGWRQLKNNEDFWGRVERFLDKNIGAARKP
ncbi:prolyl oligopeptidase family serine peptidase [Paucibacter sp. AS339]|uniref:alpha/beta hydrolase family protein n=1 Tax=Paucibacter hankyongi TaxID=3133434 RepID=UPI0030B3D9B7